MAEELQKKQIQKTAGPPRGIKRTNARHVFRLDSSAYHYAWKPHDSNAAGNPFRVPRPPEAVPSPSTRTDEFMPTFKPITIPSRPLAPDAPTLMFKPVAAAAPPPAPDAPTLMFRPVSAAPPPTPDAQKILRDAEDVVPYPQKTLYRPRLSTPPWTRRIFPPRFVAFVALAVILFAPLALFSTVFRVVYLTVDGQSERRFVTRLEGAEDILRDAGFAPGPADRYTLTQCGLEAHLELERAARITLICDGRQRTIDVLHKTVRETLDLAEIELGPDDECNLPLDYVLQNKDRFVVVYRVYYGQSQRSETVPWQEITKPSPLIPAGTAAVMNPGGGRNGTALRTYSDKYVDGTLWDSVVIDERLTSFARNVITLEGKPDAIMSAVNGSAFTDIQIVDNAPAIYQKVFSAQPCTAYSFSPGCYGASGMYLFQGFVAVDPAKIPLGSLLYITSPNGRFVYGWAIAADTGEAMMAGRVAVDCFFETYRESVLFGRRTMNIYVVKQLTQSELAPYMAAEGMFKQRIPS